MTEGVTSELADFADGVRYEDIPAQTRHIVARHVLDQLGVQACVTSLPWIAPVHSYVRSYAKAGVSSVIGTDRRLDAEAAALVNGTAGHGFEMDDYLTGTLGHPGCVVVSSCLAVAQELEATGREFLVAASVAFEVAVRIAKATMPEMLFVRGFHPTSVHGTFAAAIGAGLLLGSDAGHLQMALGIAGSHVSGVAEYAQTGGEVKRYHAGMASAAGIRSARLAEAGLTAPPTILEGRRGALQAVCPEPRLDVLTESLGDTWVLGQHLSIKTYCCAGSIHPVIGALHHLMDVNGLTAADIASMRAGMNRNAVRHVGALGPRPKDMTEAQLSGRYSLALAAVHRDNGFDTYLTAWEAGFRDDAVSDLASRIEIEDDDEVERDFPRLNLGRVSIRTRDGRELSHVSGAKGSVQDPLTDAELSEKFYRNAVRSLSPQACESIERSVFAIDQVTNMRNLHDVLGARAPARADETLQSAEAAG